MFKSSRRKIILSIMGLLILLFAVTLSVILFASFREIRKKNLDMLERYAETYTLDPKPPAQEKPEPGREMRNPPMDERHDYEVSTFYAVALAEDGSVLKVDTAGKSFYEEDALVESAGEVLAGSKLSGRSGNLTYAVSKKDGVTLVAFMDNTVSEAGLRTMLRTVLTVGGAGTIDSIYAHKPGVIAADGALYHFYCACRPHREGDPADNGGEFRCISVARSQPWT